jgi:hypothetical protein
MFTTKFPKDYYAGGLMFLIGVAAAIQSVHYSIGTLTEMGSGFFPAALGAILALLGLAILLRARRPAFATEGRPAPEWRGWLCILASIVAFVVLGEYGGLVPATFAIVFIAALGDRANSWKDALFLALAMAAVAVVVFWWALSLQFPLFQWGTP